MNDDLSPLSDLQLELMRVLWDRREATVSEVRDALPRSLASTTIATVLSRMEKRGLVGHTVSGRQFLYHALVDENDVLRNDLSEFTRRWFQGDPAALVSHLLGGEEISSNDLAHMKDLLSQKARPKKGTKNGC